MALDLESPDAETGDPPESRVKDYSSFVRLYRKLKESDLPAARNRRMVQNLVDGQPPFNQADMEAAGFGDFANFNSLEAQAACDQAKTVFTGLLGAVPVLIRVKTKYGDKAMRDQWQQAIAEEYTTMVRAWSSYNSHKQQMAAGLVTDGLRIAYWPHDVDWRSEVGNPGQFLFPSNAPVDESKQDLMLQEETITATKLYRLLKKDDEVQKAGDKSYINRDAVEKAIQDACRKDSNFIGQTLYDFFEDNDLCVSYADAQEIKLVHGYIAEYEGGISHYIGRADGEGKDFLYQKRDAMPCMEDSFVFYADGVGDGRLASLKGIIWRAYPQFYQKNVSLCQAYDAVRLSTILPLKLTQGANVRETMAQLKFDRVMVLPPGVEVVPGGIFNNGSLNAVLELLSKTDSVAANNTGGYQNHDFSPEGGGRTAREVSLQAANQAQISSALVINWYQSEEAWNRITFKRLQNKDYASRHPGWKERQEMLDRLQARGVPLQAFWDVYEVSTVRAIGLGSPAQQAASFQLLNSKRVFADPVGQRVIDRLQLTAGNIEASIIDEALPMLPQPRASEQDADAISENASFACGLPIMPKLGDDPYIHIPQHLPFLGFTLQQAEQGIIDPKQAVRQIGAAGPHIQAHLKACQHPQRVQQVKEWQQAYSQIDGEFQKLVAQVQQSQQPPEQATQPNVENGDEARKQQAFEMEQRRLDAESQAEIQRKNLQAQTTLDTRNATHQQQLAHRDINTAAQVLDNSQQTSPIILP